MNLKKIKNICFGCLAFLIFSYALEINALSDDWVAVPESQYGEQLWDKSSVEKNEDGSIRVLSKFIPKTTNAITQDILYTMEINYSQK